MQLGQWLTACQTIEISLLEPANSGPSRVHQLLYTVHDRLRGLDFSDRPKSLTWWEGARIDNVLSVLFLHLIGSMEWRTR
jgi:hypothetical protein